MAELNGAVAFVTGGSRGIGRAVCARLASEGADVAFTYVSAGDQAAKVVAEIEELGRRAWAIRADSADAEALGAAVNETVARFGRLDVLVNSAGVFPYGPFHEVGLDELDRVMAIHARAAFVATQAASPHLREGGRVISIGSNLAERVPHGGTTLYSMSKAALVGLTKGLARELGPRGITANLIQPGPTDTDMNPAEGPGAEEQRTSIPLGHFGSADDVAAMVVHLAGPGGRFVNGASILVDGGANA
ncbi:MAG TPA: 3-oxoacyl-ACP reductase family protein [Jiangellaceae bacterium]